MNYSNISSSMCFGSGFDLSKLNFMLYVFDNNIIQIFHKCMRHLIGLNRHDELFNSLLKGYYEIKFKSVS